MIVFFFFFKQKTAYEMRISDWSSDVCSSDLENHPLERCGCLGLGEEGGNIVGDAGVEPARRDPSARRFDLLDELLQLVAAAAADLDAATLTCKSIRDRRSDIVSGAPDTARCVYGFYCHALTFAFSFPSLVQLL